MEPVFINFKSFNERENVLVIGAGPSFNTNKVVVEKFIKEHNPVIIGSNYNYPSIKSDYTVFIGKSIFSKSRKAIKSSNIIVTNHVYENQKKNILSDKKHKYFILNTSATTKQHSYWNESEITFKKNKFQHWLSNCGYTALLSSVFFKPKRVLIVGFDGPVDNGSKIEHFNGDTRDNKGEVHSDVNIIQLKGNFLELIFKFLRENGVNTINTFTNEKLWGANRSLTCLI